MSQIPSRVVRPLSSPGLLNMPAPPRLQQVPLYTGRQSYAEILGIARQAGDLAFEVNRQQMELDERLRHQWEGQADRHTSEVLPQLEADIRTGTLVPAQSPDAIVAQADTIIAERFGADGALDVPAFRERIGETVRPRLIQALSQARAAADEDKRLEAAATWAVRASTETDPATLDAIMAEARSNWPAQRVDELDDRVTFQAARLAALRGDVEQAERLAARLPDRLADQRPVLAQAAKETLSAAAEERVWGAANGGLPAVRVLDLIRDGTPALGEEKAARLSSHFTTIAQNQTEQSLRFRVLAGQITPDEVRNEVLAAARLAETDPGYLSPQTGAAIMGLVTERRARDVAAEEVARVLTSGRGHLTEARHGSALGDLLGPEGIGAIDDLGRIANPDALATALSTARVLPRQTAAAIVANITGDDPADIAAAGLVVGALAVGSPRLYAELLDSAGRRFEPVLTEAAEQYQRGRLQGEGTVSAAVQRIRDALAVKQDTPEPDADAVTAAEADGVVVADQIAAVAAQLRTEAPHATDTFMGIDWLNPDPADEPGDANVGAKLRHWFLDRYSRVRGRLPRVRAMEEASRYALAQARNSIDLVRWGDTVTPVLVDDGSGLRLPDHLRWAEGFEDEARADLSAAGFDPEDVAAMRPFLNPPVAPGEDPESKLGWLFVGGDGVPLVDDDGNLIVYRPTDKAQQRAAEWRRLLDQKDRAFAERQRAIREASKSPGELQGFGRGIKFDFGPERGYAPGLPTGPFIYDPAGAR